jgi:DNA repair exonuclease SbcCD ATPase subunit
VTTKMREDLARQFSSDSDNNPLAGFQKASLAVIRQTSDQQAEHLRLMSEKLEALKLELAGLRAERDKQLEVAAVEERGTAKGRTYEQAVAEALDEIAAARGDVSEAVGDVRGSGSRKGDVVVSVDACAGPARGRIVFEAKKSQLSRPRALAELDEALSARDADYAVLVVPGEAELPARTQPLREFNGDKLFVTFDPDEGSRLTLEVAYALARARVLMRRGAASGLDLEVVRAEVERAQQAMEDVRRIKSQLTSAEGGIDEARKILERMAATVRSHLEQIEGLLVAQDPAVE